MRTGGFVVVLVFVLMLVGYVCWHLWRIAPGVTKWVVVSLFFLWMVCFFVNFAIMNRAPVGVATVLYEVGNTWLIAFLYLLLLFVLSDVAVVCHLLPKTLFKDSVIGFVSIVGIVAAVMTVGGFHYHKKYREEIKIVSDKPLEKPLTVVLASDLHLGYHNRKTELARWVGLINAEHPDLVLLGGDVVDMGLRPVMEGDYAEEIRRIKAPVWTVLGNHEYYSHVDEVERFFADASIMLLKDSVSHFKGVDVIGRNDRTNPKRKRLEELVAGLEGFTILLDHQPYHLEEAEAAGIDFQFSGHTHRGQVWPLSWITDIMYEKSWGQYRRGSTLYYISSGLGIWGPKIRIGTRSEYIVLHIENK